MPGIDRAGKLRAFGQLVKRDAEAMPDRRRIVGDEHIGVDDEIVDDLARLRTFEIECQTAFVAIIHRPTVVPVADRHARQEGNAAVGIALAGRLDLDHVRTEIGHDGGCGGSRNEARGVEHLESGENTWLAHRSSFLDRRSERSRAPRQRAGMH